MNAFELAAVVVTLAALFGYINYRFIKLPATIGVMLISLLFSLVLILAQRLGFDMAVAAGRILGGIDFNTTLMQGMLSFLLFAGALNVSLEDLLRYKWSVALFTLFGVALSTLIIGLLLHLLLARIGLEVSPAYCFLFGALISPTDPIAVLARLKQLHAPKSLEINIAGEALFNDGLGVVVFLALYEVVSSGHPPAGSRLVLLFLSEAFGGIALGLALGWVTYRLLRSIDHYQVEVLLTLALVTGGYALANALHASGPLAMVAAGVLIGNPGRHHAMSEKTRMQIDTFWELIDEILNAVLFVLIGLEMLTISLRQSHWLLGLAAIPIVLVARWASILTPAALLSRELPTGTMHVAAIMTWGGLRGGIPVALALTLPPGQVRDLLLTLTYAVVVFSIAVQGLTIPFLLRRMVKTS
jgi:monovalent cation:H+ antiporter, CPA1 family